MSYTRAQKLPYRGASPGGGETNWQARRDSNPQPAVLETAALPLELLACDALNWILAQTGLVGHEGFEPSTLRLKGGCSNQLS